MPLGTRDVLLTIRAKDSASSVLRDLALAFKTVDTSSMSAAAQADLAITKQKAMGSGLVAVGALFTAAGTAGMAFYIGSARAAIEYQKQAALTLTQVDNQKISLQQIKQIGEEVASVIPVPFKEVQSGLYDIFSSLDVNLAQAKQLLIDFSKEAVAGNLSLSDASRSTIGVLNAYHLPLTATNNILDTQFQLVRKGVGTYADFANSIGRAIPQSVLAGQNFDTLAGTVAFLTRSHLSAANAATSAGRAMQAFANPAFAERLKAYGINVVDAQGHFRNFGSVIDELNDKLSKMTGPERTKAILDMLHGIGSTAQAQRFFGLALDPGNKALFDEMNKAMDPSQTAGLAEKAYEQMAKTGVNQLQLLKNNWDILRVSVGEAVLPAFATFVGILAKLVQGFNNLPGPIKKFIEYGGLIASIMAVIVGVVLVLAGAFLILAAAFAVTDAAGAPIFLIILAIIAVFVLLVAAITAVFIWHKQIWDFMKMVWNDLNQFVGTKIGAIVAIFVPFFGILLLVIHYHQQIWDFMKQVWAAIPGIISTAISAMMGALNTFINFFPNTWNTTWNAITSATSTAFNNVVGFFKRIPTEVANAFNDVMSYLAGELPKLPDQIAYWLGFALGRFIKWHIDAVNDIIKFGKDVLSNIDKFFTQLPGKLQGYLTTALTNIARWVSNSVADIGNMGQTMLNTVGKFFSQLPGKILGYLNSAYHNITTWGSNSASSASTTGSKFVANVISYIGTLPTKIWNILTSVLSLLYRWDVNMTDTIKAVAHDIVTFFIREIQNLPSLIWNVLVSAANKLSSAGNMMWNAAKNIGSSAWNGFKSGLGISSPSHIERAMDAITVNMHKNVGLIKGHISTLREVSGTLPNVNNMMSASAQNMLGYGYGQNSSTWAMRPITIAQGAVVVHIPGTPDNTVTPQTVRDGTALALQTLLTEIQSRKNL